MSDDKNKKMIDIIGPATKKSEPAPAPTPTPVFISLKKENEIEKKLEEFDEKVEKFEKEEIDRFKTEEEVKKSRKLRLGISLKTFTLILIILALIGGIIYSALNFLPRGEIKIITKKAEWDYIDSIAAAKNIATIDAIAKQIPGEVFSQRKNLTLVFPATGKQHIERKAKGKIIIYNAYSSNSQTLVAGTRFSAPDGKIFRLDNRTVVPGAKISEGKIVSSSIEAAITAEKPGEAYNIGPINRLTFPGFQGTAKYEGFYGTIKEQLIGGFIGEIAVPTEADTKQGREKTLEALKENLDAFILSQASPQFKIIEGSKQFVVIKENIAKEADAANNFSVFIEAESSLLVFKESDLLEMLGIVAKNNLGSDFTIKNFQMEYGVGRADFAGGKISFPVNFTSVLWQPIESKKIKQLVLNKKEDELRTILFSLPGVEKATISLWPFWVKRVPNNFNRIKVDIE